MTGNKAIRLPFWATLLTLLGLIVLCGLGAWQVQRLAWKQDIITKLDQAYEGQSSAALDLDNITDNFAYGRVSGRLLADKALLLGPRTQNKEIGNDLIVPLQTNGRTLLINMGWSNWPLEDMPIKHLNGKTVWFEGLINTPHWNSFTPPNEPDKDLWYRADINEIAEVKALKEPYPFVLRAEHASHKYDAAFPNNERLYPNNNHLQYAFFWFAMATALIVIYVLRFITNNKKAG